eukprot:759578-Hanusia_phi.AAC.5
MVSRDVQVNSCSFHRCRLNIPLPGRPLIDFKAGNPYAEVRHTSFTVTFLTFVLRSCRMPRKLPDISIPSLRPSGIQRRQADKAGDGTVRLWDVRSCHEGDSGSFATSPGRRTQVPCAIPSDFGGVLALTSEGNILLWDDRVSKRNYIMSNAEEPEICIRHPTSVRPRPAKTFLLGTRTSTSTCAETLVALLTPARCG